MNTRTLRLASISACLVLLCAGLAPAGWVLVDDFDAYTPAATIDGQGNWTSTMNPPNATVEARPTGGAPSQALRMFNVTRARDDADLPAMPDTGHATFFFQVNMAEVSGYNDFRVTLADETPPSSYTQSDVFFRMDGRTDQYDSYMWRNHIKVGAGDANQTVTNYRLDNSVWYNVWLDVDGASETYQVHVAPPGGAAPMPLAVGGTTTFPFDSASGPMESVWLWSDGTSHDKAIFLDNMYVDTAGANLTSPVSALPVVTQTASHPYGQSWDNGTYWDDSQPAHAGAVYVVPSGVGMRTPHNASNPTFPGDALTIQAGGNMGLKHNGVVTFEDLHLAGGQINCSVGNRTMAIGGNLTVDTNSTFSISGGNTRTTELRSTLFGDGNLALVGGTTGTSRFILRADTSMYNGTFTVNANMENLYVDRGTMRVSGGLDLNLLRAGYEPGEGEVIVLDGAVHVVDASQAMDVGRRTQALTRVKTTTGIANFAASSGTTLDVSQLRIGTINGSPSGEGTARGDLILSLAGTNSITADSILVGDSPSRGNTAMSTIQLGGAANTISTDTLTLGGRKGQGTMSIAPGGTLTLGGKSGAAVDVNLGINVNGTGTNGIGTIDMLGGTINATIGQLRMGNQNGGGGSGTGNLLFDAGTINVDDIVMTTGNKSVATITQRGGALHVAGGVTDGTGASALQVDDGTMTVGNGLAVDALRVGNAGAAGANASLTVNAGAARIGTGSENLDIGVRSMTLSGSPTTVGLLDLSATTGVTVDVANVRIGNILSPDSGEGTARGDLILSQAGNNSITADSIIVGNSPNRGNTVQSTIQLGGAQNTISADTLTVGGLKGNGKVTIAPGGTLTLGGKSGAAVDVNIGLNVTGNTGTNALGILDMTGGQLNATIGQLRIGRHPTGSGSGVGTFAFDAGSVHADSVTVGLNGGEGTFTAGGGTVSVGSGGAGHDLFVGRRTGNVGGGTATQLQGVFDVSAATSFTADVGTFGIGYVTGGGGGQGYPTGTVLLSPDNTITADALIVAHSPSVGLGGKTNRIAFGAANTVNVDAVTIGGSKGVALADIAPGGVLTLGGKSGARADMLVGDQPVGTGGGSHGTADFSGGTINAMLGSLIIGQKVSAANGTTDGVFTMDAGAVDANSILLGNRIGGGGGQVTGTFNLKGGSLAAGSITLGQETGIGVFNFTGGTLTPGDHGTLAFEGDYTQPAGGTLQIGLDGNGANDVLDVAGTVKLNNGMLDLVFDYTPAEMDSWIILANDGTDAITDEFKDMPEGSRFYVPGSAYPLEITYHGGTDRNDVALTAVPEPATLALLGLAGASLGAYIRRRRTR